MSDQAQAHHQIKELERMVAAQEALVHRMIVQGVPNQAAEDRLRELQQKLELARAQNI